MPRQSGEMGNISLLDHIIPHELYPTNVPLTSQYDPFNGDRAISHFGSLGKGSTFPMFSVLSSGFASACTL